MANLTWAHLGIKFPSGQHSHEKLLWKSKFEIITSTVISSHFRILMYYYPHGLPFSYGSPRECDREEEKRNCLSTCTIGWMFARLVRGCPRDWGWLLFYQPVSVWAWHRGSECSLRHESALRDTHHFQVGACCTSKGVASATIPSWVMSFANTRNNHVALVHLSFYEHCKRKPALLFIHF